MNIKELAKKESRFVSGHRACAGCGFPQIVRTILASTDKKVVVANATGCLEVVSTIYPFSSWKVPYIHSAFENAGSTISGIESAYKVLKKKGFVKEDFKFLAIGGDGGVTDIGLQSLSGMLERGHDVVFVQYDNNAYQNTGVQRSGATPYGAATSTTPVGSVHKGKEIFKKDIMKIVLAHDVPYAAQASLSNLEDLSEKARKAFEVKGPAFLNVLQPCTLGWKFPTNITVEVASKAVDSCFWPLYEVENGKYKLNYKPSKKVPVLDYIKLQGRYKHLLKDEKILAKLQKHVDEKWEELLKLCS
jgi:pyruvate ferredoxin oxidoreductase beta subunit